VAVWVSAREGPVKDGLSGRAYHRDVAHTIRRLSGCSELVARAGAVLEAREAEHCLILGLCSTILAHPEIFVDPWFAVAEDGDAIVGAALQTPPHNIVLSELGHCFMQTGVPEVAVKWLTKGLNAPNISDDERIALMYELGAAYEQAGDLDHALESFTEVYGVNVSYRNVNERLKMLKARLGEKTRSARKAEQTEMVN
jgi:tetratricopeptide (TPR) repeat protein